MLQPLLVGLTASSALVIGALVGLYLKPPERLVAVLLGFASGSLIVAVAFDLFEEAYLHTGLVVSGTGLICGAAAFMGITSYIDRHAAALGGLYLLASVTLDGMPENLALGVALIGKSWVDIAALVLAIFFSNLPESMAGAVYMRQEGRSHRFVLGVWGLTAAILTATVLLGHEALRDVGDTPVALARSVAAGAVIASLAEALMPQAYERGGKVVAFATALGFFVSFAVTR